MKKHDWVVRKFVSRLSVVMVALLTICAVGDVKADTTWSGVVTLESNLTETGMLTIDEGANIDLNGHSVSLTGTLSVGGRATVTNSDAGVLVDFSVDSSGYQNQFQNLTFSGNLKLSVKGTVGGNGGFQDAVNTHTGGTRLEGYTYTDKDSNMPRFNNSTAFGTGPLTLVNGTQLRFVGSAITLSNSSLVVEGGGDNLIIAEQGITLEETAKLVIPKDSRLLIQCRGRYKRASFACDMSGVEGVLAVNPFDSDSYFYFSGGSQKFTNGILEFVPGSSAVRWAGDRSSLPKDDEGDYCFDLGGIKTPDETTKPVDAKFVNTSGQGRIKVRIGWANTDTTFYGYFGSDNNNNKDMALEKVGSGTFTLGSTNSYYGATYLADGVIRLLSTATLGRVDSTSDIVFKGGTLVFAEENAVEPSARFKAKEGKIVKIGVEAGVVQPIAGTFAGCGDFEKVGAGTLVMKSAPAHTGKTTVAEGSLVIPAESTLAAALEIAEGARLLIDASSADWEDGEEVTLFTCGANSTGISAESIGLYGVSDKTAIDDVTITEEGKVKATVATKTLRWNGADGASWDFSSKNWVAAGDGANPYAFADADRVVFNDDSFGEASELTVVIPADVAPRSMEFAHTEGHTLYLTGEGAVELGDFTKTGRGTVSLGNGKNRFGGTLTVAEGTLALGTDQPLDSETYTLKLAPNVTLDLAGHDLTVGTATQTDSTGALSLVTNSVDATMATFTVGVNNGAYLSNNRYVFGGNLRYWITGDCNATYFRDSNNSIANTHTGGTVFSNQTKQVRFYRSDNFGSGPLCFFGRSAISLPSMSLGELTFGQPIEVRGAENRLNLEGYNWGPNISLTGNWSGDGELKISNGFKPKIYLAGSMNDFEGTLWMQYDGANGFIIGTDNVGAEKAKWKIGSDNNSKTNKCNVYMAKAGTYRLGTLASASENVDSLAQTFIANDNADTTTLQIGSRNEDSLYAANFRESKGTLNIEKVGMGTLTLMGTNTTIRGTTTVTGGKLVLGMPKWESSVTVKSGATIGTAAELVLPSVSFEEGAMLMGKDAFVRAKIVIGQPSLTAELIAANEAPNARGRWIARVKANGDGTKTCEYRFSKYGFMLIVR